MRQRQRGGIQAVCAAGQKPDKEEFRRGFPDIRDRVPQSNHSKTTAELMGINLG